MVSRRGVIQGMALCGVGLAAGCGFGPSAALRYRMIVEVQTPQGLRTGSGMIESQIDKGPATGQASGITYDLRGEAVAVDMGDGRMLFALLSDARRVAADYHADLFHSALESGARAIPPLPRRYESQEWREERAAARAVKPSVILPRALYPKLARLRDPADVRTIDILDPDDLSGAFGMGVAVRRIGLRVTDDELAFKLDGHLPEFGAGSGYEARYGALAYGDPRGVGPGDFQQKTW
jgi:hypothetical protein